MLAYRQLRTYVNEAEGGGTGEVEFSFADLSTLGKKLICYLALMSGKRISCSSPIRLGCRGMAFGGID